MLTIRKPPIRPRRAAQAEPSRAELFTDTAIRFIRERGSKQPFFLYAAYTAPHDPRTAPEPYADMYAPEAVSLPPNFLPEHPFYYYAEALGTSGSREEARPPEWELFDLVRDRFEMNNVYGHPDYADVADRLKQELALLQRQVGDQPVMQVD